jgi:hypothetical protein
MTTGRLAVDRGSNRAHQVHRLHVLLVADGDLG